MKFLHEMIAKKRQAQTEAHQMPADAQHARDDYEPSSPSPDVVPLAANEAEPASASVIPYRQRQDEPGDGSADAENNGFGSATGGYDWDVSGIDLSAERATPAATESAPEDAQMAAEPASIGTEMSELETDFSAIGGSEDGEAPDHSAEDEPAHPASAFAEQDAPNDEAPENKTAASSETPWEAQEAAQHGDSDEAEESEMTTFDAETPETETRHKSAAEAAASFARQVQQRKIWDIQPPETAEDHEDEDDGFVLVSAPTPDDNPADAPAEPEAVADAEPQLHMTDEAMSSDIEEPTADLAEASEPEPETVAMQVAQTETAGSQPDPEIEQETDVVEPEPQVAGSDDEASVVDTGVEDDADEIAAAPAPARRRAGRVKTRLLGFHKHEDESVDPISAAAQSPSGQAQFPVGWVVVLKGPGRGASFTLTAGASKIGRGEDQAVRLDFGDNSISRDNHAVVAYDNEQRRFFIGHGGKANLVRLNDMPVLSTEPLKDGDTIRIGETTLWFTALCGPDFSWDDEDVETAHAASH